MYKCSYCGHIFEDPNVEQTTYESYYGCPFPASTPLTLYKCPECGEEVGEDDEVDENAIYTEDLRREIKSLPAFEDYYDIYDMSNIEEIINDFEHGDCDYADALDECEKLIQECMTHNDIAKEAKEHESSSD